jgi:Lon protease-like protein
MAATIVVAITEVRAKGDNVAGSLLEIPLFPLHVVLYPGMAMPLHIFEPRYRRMTSDCLDSNLPIGIVLAMPGSVHGHEIPARVGTFARIIDYERLPDGRYNLLTIGTQRFRIVKESYENQLYLMGQVEPLEDIPDADTREQAYLAAEAHEALAVYLRTVLALLGSEERAIEVPEDAADLSYLIATCLGCDDDQKQRMLEITSISDRLTAGIHGLRAEIEALEHQSEGGKGDSYPPFDVDHTGLN